jgi:hypothetical protein
MTTEGKAADNTGLAKVAVQCSADTFVVNQSLVLRINICGENRQLLVAAKRQAVKKPPFSIKFFQFYYSTSQIKVFEEGFFFRLLISFDKNKGRWLALYKSFLAKLRLLLCRGRSIL